MVEFDEKRLEFHGGFDGVYGREDCCYWITSGLIKVVPIEEVSCCIDMQEQNKTE